MPILIDSATVASPSDTNCDSSQLMGQSFQVQNSCNLDNLIIDVKKVGTISGSFQFEIYAMTGTYGSTSKPTGSPIATSDSISTAGITTSYATITAYFTGANAIAMTTGQQYVLVCNYAATAYPNALLFKNKTPSFHGGNQSYKTGGAWTELGSYDIIFDLEGVSSSVNVTVNSTVVSVTASTQAPTISAGASIAPNVLTATFSVQSATELIDEYFTPAQAITATFSIPVPNIITPDAQVDVSVLSAVFSVPTPTASGNADISASVQSALFSLPTVEFIGSVSISPDAQVATFSILAPTISAVGNVSISASTVAATFSLQSPTVTAEQNAMASAGVLTATFSTLAVTITAERNVLFDAPVMVATFSIQRPTKIGGLWTAQPRVQGTWTPQPRAI